VTAAAAPGVAWIWGAAGGAVGTGAVATAGVRKSHAHRFFGGSSAAGIGGSSHGRSGGVRRPGDDMAEAAGVWGRAGGGGAIERRDEGTGRWSLVWPAVIGKGGR
jgi:hypothetical protein